MTNYDSRKKKSNKEIRVGFQVLYFLLVFYSVRTVRQTDRKRFVHFFYRSCSRRHITFKFKLNQNQAISGYYTIESREIMYIKNELRCFFYFILNFRDINNFFYSKNSKLINFSFVFFSFSNFFLQMKILIVIFAVLAAANAVSFLELIKEEWNSFKVIINSTSHFFFRFKKQNTKNNQTYSRKKKRY